MVKYNTPRRTVQKPDDTTGKKSELLKEVLEERLSGRASKGTLAAEIYREMGYGSASSASHFISQVASGLIYGTCGTPLYPAVQLYRLSVVLEKLGLPKEEKLGLPKEHKLLSELRKVRGFEYPPVLTEDITMILESR